MKKPLGRKTLPDRGDIDAIDCLVRVHLEQPPRRIASMTGLSLAEVKASLRRLNAVTKMNKITKEEALSSLANWCLDNKVELQGCYHPFVIKGPHKDYMEWEWEADEGDLNRTIEAEKARRAAATD